MIFDKYSHLKLVFYTFFTIYYIYTPISLEKGLTPISVIAMWQWQGTGF